MKPKKLNRAPTDLHKGHPSPRADLRSTIVKPTKEQIANEKQAKYQRAIAKISKYTPAKLNFLPSMRFRNKKDWQNAQKSNPLILSVAKEDFELIEVAREKLSFLQIKKIFITRNRKLGTNGLEIALYGLSPEVKLAKLKRFKQIFYKDLQENTSSHARIKLDCLVIKLALTPMFEYSIKSRELAEKRIIKETLISAQDKIAYHVNEIFPAYLKTIRKEEDPVSAFIHSVSSIFKKKLTSRALSNYLVKTLHLNYMADYPIQKFGHFYTKTIIKLLIDRIYFWIEHLENLPINKDDKLGQRLEEYFNKLKIRSLLANLIKIRRSLGPIATSQDKNNDDKYPITPDIAADVSARFVPIFDTKNPGSISNLSSAMSFNRRQKSTMGDNDRKVLSSANKRQDKQVRDETTTKQVLEERAIKHGERIATRYERNGIVITPILEESLRTTAQKRFQHTDIVEIFLASVRSRLKI